MIIDLTQERDRRAEKDNRSQMCCFNNNYIVHVKAFVICKAPLIASIL